MKIHGFCLFVLLSAGPAAQAQATPANETDENLDRQVKALDKQIKALEDQIDELRNKQALLLAERAARAAKQRALETREHFARVEVRGKLTPSDSFTAKWKLVVNRGRSWEVPFPEQDKELRAAVEKLINKEVVISGIALWSLKPETFPQFRNPPSNPFGVPASGYRPPPAYLYVVSAPSLQPAAGAAKDAGEQELLQSAEALRKRIDTLSRKGDDITKRELNELAVLHAESEKLGKELQAHREKAKVHFRGKLVPDGLHAWQIQIGPAPHNWKLDLGNKPDLKALAREQEGKEVILTGTIAADTYTQPTVNVESLKRAAE
jgi:chaperonin cofactor prefoldin